jgi:perosamine synthetase
MRSGNYSLETNILSVFSFMKSAATLRETQVRSIEFSVEKTEKPCYLVPVGKFFADDSSLVSAMGKWRDAHQYAYPSRFAVTDTGTAKWLKSAVIDNENRLLFLMQDPSGKYLGHIGFLKLDETRCEIDNVLRGESEVPGIVNSALRELERFASEELGLESLELRVLASNSHAVDFYLRNDYHEINRIGLTNSGAAGEINLVESTENISDHFIVMAKNLRDSKMAQGEILTAGPSISNRELTFVSDATMSGWNYHHSDYLNKFQDEFAEYVGAKFAIPTSSCTGALHLSLLALGIGPGDEVIIPEVTWVATASAVRYVGATPIFADIDPATWCIDPKAAREKINSKTKAIMPVHLYGFAADMNAITALAKEHNLYIVEDAAPAIGTLIDGKPAGSFGEFGAYSFQGAKMLVTGEGGMLVTSDPELYERARKIQDHGRKPGTFWIEELGYKYKMNNVTAALGLAQLERSENQINQKRRIAGWYQELLGGHASLKMQFESTGTRSIHWMNSVTLDESLSITRDEVMEKLKADGIDTRPVFPAISQYPIWDKVHEPGPVATRVGANSINLPSGVKLSKKSIERVCQSLVNLI